MPKIEQGRPSTPGFRPFPKGDFYTLVRMDNGFAIATALENGDIPLNSQFVAQITECQVQLLKRLVEMANRAILQDHSKFPGTNQEQ
jgi:hypothetical protein